jgi:hypothetical protein
MNVFLMNGTNLIKEVLAMLLRNGVYI